MFRSIPEENLEKINQELEKDIMIRAIHDVKGIDMGSYLVRYKAELDFDGRELTRAYLDKMELNDILEVRIFKWKFHSLPHIIYTRLTLFIHHLNLLNNKIHFDINSSKKVLINCFFFRKLKQLTILIN